MVLLLQSQLLKSSWNTLEETIGKFYPAFYIESFSSSDCAGKKQRASESRCSVGVASFTHPNISIKYVVTKEMFGSMLSIC